MKLSILIFVVPSLLVGIINAKPLIESETNENEIPISSIKTKNTMNEAIDLLRRITREATEKTTNSDRKLKSTCKYRKGSWSACDPETKLRIRTFTLKKGDTSCEVTKTLRKECKGKGTKKGGKQRNNSKNRTSNNNMNPDKSLRSRT